MDDRQKKQTVVIAVFAAIFLLFVFFIYSIVKPKPTCFDGTKNQNEEDVDCGGVCQAKCAIKAVDLTVGKTGFLAGGAGSYDLFAEVINPNYRVGSGQFQYEFTLKDSSGSVLAKKSGVNFILPGEKKYVIETSVPISGTVASAEFRAYNPQWTEFSTDYQQKPELRVVNKNYSEISSGVGFAEATGLLKNESLFDFSNIKLKIILKDSSDNIVGLNSTEMNTVKSGEVRDFRAFWPNRFTGDVRNMEVQTDVNVFNSESFIKKYFNPGTSTENYR